MELNLSATEVRVLGCLLEKEATTPEYYPLTLNGLVLACNQRNNREPVVEFDEKTVVRALESLREKHLALRIDSAGARVPKYRHTIQHLGDLSRPQLAALTVLLLRGPQTVGEIRARSERHHPFADLAEVDAALIALTELHQHPLIAQLPRQPGKKEVRYAHLLAGPPPEPDEDQAPSAKLEPATLAVLEERRELAALQSAVEELRQDLAQTRQALALLEERFERFRMDLGA